VNRRDDRFGANLPPLAPGPDALRHLVNALDTTHSLNTELETQVERLARRAQALLVVAIAQAILVGVLVVVIAVVILDNKKLL
jgi:hypothetical protein